MNEQTGTSRSPRSYLPTSFPLPFPPHPAAQIISTARLKSGLTTFIAHLSTLGRPIAESERRRREQPGCGKRVGRGSKRGIKYRAGKGDDLLTTPPARHEGARGCSFHPLVDSWHNANVPTSIKVPGVSCIKPRGSSSFGSGVDYTPANT